MRGAAAILLCALLLAGCEPAARQAVPGPLPTLDEPTPGDLATATPSEAAPARRSFRQAIAEPGAIIPTATATADDRFVVDALFDSLTTVDRRGDAAPAAAVGWRPDGDGRSWTFDLRPEATFHDGSPVTAEDFVRSWTALVTSGPMAFLLRDIVGHDALVAGATDRLAGLSAPDPLTLVVRLSRPRADFPILVSHPATGPLPATASPPDPAFLEQPVGNGPFRMDEPWAHGEFIRTARFDAWRNGPRPEDGIAEILFRIADIDTSFLAFRQGRLDFAPVPTEALALAEAEFPPTGRDRSGPGLISSPIPSTYLLAINRQVEPYDDPAVREAVSLLVDRDRIVAQNPGANLDVARSVLPVVLSPRSDEVCELCTFNPTGGQARLEQAGVSQLTLEFNAEGGQESVRDVLREALSDIGVGLVSNRRGPPLAFPDYLARLGEGRVGMFRYTVTADVPSSLEVLYPLLHSSEVPAAGGLNYLRYRSPVVDALLDQAARTIDREQREGLLRRVEDLVVNRDHVLVPVVSYRQAYVSAEEVSGLELSPFGLIDHAALRLV